MNQSQTKPTIYFTLQMYNYYFIYSYFLTLFSNIMRLTCHFPYKFIIT